MQRGHGKILRARGPRNLLRDSLLKKEENTKGRRVNLGGIGGRLSGHKYNQIGCVKLSKENFITFF